MHKYAYVCVSMHIDFVLMIKRSIKVCISMYIDFVLMIKRSIKVCISMHIDFVLMIKRSINVCSSMHIDFALMIKRSIKVCISMHKQQCKVEQPRKLFKASISNFQVSKICEKGYMEMTKKKLPSAFKKFPGSLHFTLLPSSP